MATLVPVILCGGAGVRLWPESRESRPKPFLEIGESGRTLLSQSYERALCVASAGVSPLVVTNADYYFLSSDELRKHFRKSPLSFLLEGAARNTAGAVLLAALTAGDAHGDDAVLVVLSADHVIRDRPAFVEAAGKAAVLAEQGGLVTFGIKPTRPETGYGYLKLGAASSVAGSFVVERFVEKPDAATAARFLAEGSYLWNAGMFCFRVDAILKAAETFAPALLEAARRSYSASVAFKDGNDVGRRIPVAEMEKIPSISLDYAIMEKATGVETVACDLGWSDVGAWDSVAEVSVPDAHGNVVSGEAVLLDVRDTLVRAGHKTVAAFGVSNLVIVDTPDALLVADRTSASQLKKLVEEVRRVRPEICRDHRLMPRPWGNYQIISEGPGYKVKRIEVKVGGRLSLQKHAHRSEHWVIVSGTARVTNGDTVKEFHPNQSTYIPLGAVHRLENVGLIPLVMIEVQSGEYLGEDDIVRLEDIYSRS